MHGIVFVLLHRVKVVSHQNVYLSGFICWEAEMGLGKPGAVLTHIPAVRHSQLKTCSVKRISVVLNTTKYGRKYGLLQGGSPFSSSLPANGQNNSCNMAPAVSVVCECGRAGFLRGTNNAVGNIPERGPGSCEVCFPPRWWKPVFGSAAQRPCGDRQLVCLCAELNGE